MCQASSSLRQVQLDIHPFSKRVNRTLWELSCVARGRSHWRGSAPKSLMSKVRKESSDKEVEACFVVFHMVIGLNEVVQSRFPFHEVFKHADECVVLESEALCDI